MEKQPIKYKLGIDLGTSSIGVAAYELTENNEIKKLLYLDSYIFNEPIVEKTLVTSNTERRNARLIRRQIERKTKRLKKMVYLANSIGIKKEDIEKIKSDKIHELRAKAVNEKIELAEFIKVLFHIVKNRGYKGNLKYQGDIKEKLEKTETMLGEKTLGQFLFDKKTNTKNNDSWKKINEDGIFIKREFIEDEFEKIWSQQEQHHKELKGSYKITNKDYFPEYKNKTEITLKEAFKSAMFYQRPIKWKLDTIGNCSLYPQEYRAAQAQVIYQKYRVLNAIVNLRIKTGKNRYAKERQLNKIEIKNLYNYICDNYNEYDNRGQISYKKIYEFLNLNSDEKFTIDRNKTENENGIKGITTLFCFYNCGYDKEFKSLSQKSQEIVIEFLANTTDYSDILQNEKTYIYKKLNIEDEHNLIQNIKELTEKDIEDAKNFIELLYDNRVFEKNEFVLEKNRADYSVKALKEIVEKILESDDGKNAEQIIDELYNKIEKNKKEFILRDYKKVATNNPVIDKSLREFKRIIDSIIKKFCSNPEEITIELTRELKNPLSKRKFVEDQNKQLEKERTEIIKELKDTEINVNSTNIEKYLLAKEQHWYCPYCGQTINNNLTQTQVDHIIPQAIGGPNILANKVLAHITCNHEKGNRIPYEYGFSEDIEEYVKTLKDKKKIKNRKAKKSNEISNDFNNSPLINFIKILWKEYMKGQYGYKSPSAKKWIPTQKAKRALSKINFLLCRPDEIKDVVGEFSNLHSNSIAHINKIVLDWCRDICSNVVPSFGTLTAYLRDKFYFNDILPAIRIEENRKLFDKDGQVIETQKWQELIDKNIEYNSICALKKDFDDYILSLSEENKPKTETDWKKCFNEFKLYFRQNTKFDKRCDYRHHAVDAALIGLSTLSLIQQAAIHNARNGSLYKYKRIEEVDDIEFIDDKNNEIILKNKEKLKYDNIEKTEDGKYEIIVNGFDISKDKFVSFNNIKNEVKKYLTNFVVWHKSDHKPNGKFFYETAYNIKKHEIKEGELVSCLTSRAALEDILAKENDSKKFIEKLNKIIVGEEIKKSVINQVQERVNKGMSLKDAFLSNDLIFHKNKIKKLKIFKIGGGGGYAKFNEQTDKNVDNKKFYINNPKNAYACMDFDSKTGDLIGGVPVWKFVGNKEKIKGIRFFKDDIVYDKDSKDFYCVDGFQVANGYIELNSTVNAKKTKIRKTNIKNLILCKTKEDIIKIKKEYQNG